MGGRAAAFLLAFVASAASAAEWLQLEARPALERHMDGVPLEGPYFDCQCNLDMKCLCDKHAELPDAFLEEHVSVNGEADNATKPEPEAKPEVDLNKKADVDQEPEPSNATHLTPNASAPGPVKRNPDFDVARPYFIDPRASSHSAGCGKPACMKVNVFCANKKKSQCQKKGECCLKARREQKYLRSIENENFMKQKAKDFDEFQQVVEADAKLWRRVEKLDLWREKGQAKEQVDEAIKLKNAEYQQKLDQLDAAIAARQEEVKTLATWKADKIKFFKSRQEQLDAYEESLEASRNEVTQNRAAAVESFKANEQRMDDYLAGSESVLSAREAKLAHEEAALQSALTATKAAHAEQDAEEKNEEKDLQARAKDGTGPLPVTPEARDGKPANSNFAKSTDKS